VSETWTCGDELDDEAVGCVLTADHPGDHTDGKRYVWGVYGYSTSAVTLADLVERGVEPGDHPEVLLDRDRRRLRLLPGGAA
jgi:hypothetical protein